MPHPNDYTVGWICALATEYVAARLLLDEEHGKPEAVACGDNNLYALGRIGRHNVAITAFPDQEYGPDCAARVAAAMLSSFPNIRIGLMVGVGGGAPNQTNDIRLGDVVVSTPGNGRGGVFHYDFGKTIQNQKFLRTRVLDQPPTVVRSAVTELKARYQIHGHRLVETVVSILERNPRVRRNFKRPGQDRDRLYRTDFVHRSDAGKSCVGFCDGDPSNLITRTPRTEDKDDPVIHYGLIASASQLMRDASIRDTLAKEEGVMCFDMEAAGLMNHFPCLVIRGICNYADSHKNQEWEGYAALMAAAYARDLLSEILPNKEKAEGSTRDVLYSCQSSPYT